MEYNELSGKLEKGDVFGELDILNNSGRQNTIICLKNCILLVLEREEYMDSLMKLQKDKIEKKIIFFQSVIRLPQEIIHKNYYYFSKIKFARNNYVIK